MKFVQLHYFFITKYCGDKRYCAPPCPKVGWDVSPLNSVPVQ